MSAGLFKFMDKLWKSDIHINIYVHVENVGFFFSREFNKK